MSITLPPQVVIGTAGHVDHGKTALVAALTGTDADRLPEEQQRGMSIELGYAFCPGNNYQAPLDLGFIDCPGHQKFVRQAIAGIGAMQGCLLIIAANEGISAQTREHAELIRFLNIRFGRIIITKCDLVDEATAQDIGAAARAYMHDTPLADSEPAYVSAHSGAGIDTLRDDLFTQAEAFTHHDEHTSARLAIDRVFTVQGHGTVVTGTLLSGQIRRRRSAGSISRRNAARTWPANSWY